MRRRPLPAIVLCCAVLAAGCGGSGDSGESSGGGSSARDLFAGNCGSCHALAAADTNGTFGPSLDERKPDEATVRSAIAQGPGPMPENLLEGADADAVAAYVAENAGG